MTTLPSPRKSGGNLTKLALVGLLCAVAVLGFMAVAAPWGFYMGGSFHAIPLWQGWGRMHSNSAGGDYAVYVWFWPDHGKFRQLAYVQGRALVCTPRGEKFNLNLGGNFAKPDDGLGGRDLNGKTASFYMFNRTVKHILGGGNARPELELRGRWSNPDLVLDDHSSIQRNFDHDANLYPDGKNRPYMGEVSPVTLHEGSKSGFDAVCAAVKTR
ncbi:MAG TPA: hypothetical protein VGJ30_07225 [Candidatus Angelobacter sp.]